MDILVSEVALLDGVRLGEIPAADVKATLARISGQTTRIQTADFESSI